MKKMLRTLGLISVAALLFFGGTAQEVAGKAAGAEARIPFVLPSLKADKMPPVFFSHDRHEKAIEAKGEDCAKVCHTDSQEYFLSSEKTSAKKVVAYVHKECVSCHSLSKYGKNTGPQLASCRACHNDATAQAQARKSTKK